MADRKATFKADGWQDDPSPDTVSGRIAWLRYKLPNRRVDVGKFESGEFAVRMKMLTHDRKVQELSFALSEGAAVALWAGLDKAHKSDPFSE